ncbi:MAG: discoidin domain-containing protein, partial [Propionibacteriaceae bacterium]|nr:discoidin domain-containing protein [Propionibacteriaceae bacterium]
MGTTHLRRSLVAIACLGLLGSFLPLSTHASPVIAGDGPRESTVVTMPQTGVVQTADADLNGVLPRGVLVVGTTYYVDNVNGNDANNGTSEATAWKTTARANQAVLSPGDALRYKNGGTFVGSLIPQGSGTADAPITIGAYGDASKPKPVLTPLAEGADKLSADYKFYPYWYVSTANTPYYGVEQIRLDNVENYVIEDLELYDPNYTANMPHVSNDSGNAYDAATNPARYRRGILIYNEDAGMLSGYTFDNLTIHGYRGTNSNRGKSAGGIIFQVNTSDVAANRVASGLSDISITNSELYDLGRSGVNFTSPWTGRGANGGLLDGDRWTGRANAALFPQWYDRSMGGSDGYPSLDSTAGWVPSENVLIANNIIHTIDGDGVIIDGVDGGMVENNLVYDTHLRAQMAVGIFPWNSDNVVIQNNEVYSSGNAALRTGPVNDSQGIEIDALNTDVYVQYNYTHDNQGGWMMFCTMGGLRGFRHVWRYNISEYDDTNFGGILMISNTWSARVYNNTILMDSVGDGGGNDYFIRGLNGSGNLDEKWFNNLFYYNGPGGMPITDRPTGGDTAMGSHIMEWKNNVFYNLPKTNGFEITQAMLGGEANGNQIVYGGATGTSNEYIVDPTRLDPDTTALPSESGSWATLSKFAPKADSPLIGAGISLVDSATLSELKTPITLSSHEASDYEANLDFTYVTDFNSGQDILGTPVTTNGRIDIGAIQYTGQVDEVLVDSLAVTPTSGQITEKRGTLSLATTVGPTNATNKSVTWSITEGAELATIDPDSGLLTATGTANGTVTVVATANDDSGKTAEATVTLTGQDEPDNLALDRTYTANCQRAVSTGQSVAAAFDKSLSSYYLAPDINSGGWRVDPACMPITIGVDFGEDVTFDHVVLNEHVGEAGRIVNWYVETSNDGQTWTKVSADSGAAGVSDLTFADVTAKHARIVIDEITPVAVPGNAASDAPSVAELQIFYDGTTDVKVSSLTVSPAAGGIDQKNGTLQMAVKVGPSNAKDKSVTWSIKQGAGDTLASIDPSTGLLTANGSANGSVTVVVTANDGSGVSTETVVELTNQGRSENLATDRTYAANCEHNNSARKVGAAFDGSESTYWQAPDDNATGAWLVPESCMPLTIEIAFGEDVTFDNVVLGENGLDSGRIGNWYVETSDDGETWTKVSADSNDPTVLEAKFADVTAKYARVVIDKLVSAGQYGAPSNAATLTEIEVYLEEADPVDPVNLVVGAVCSASATRSAGVHPAQDACDQAANEATFYQPPDEDKMPTGWLVPEDKVPFTFTVDMQESKTFDHVVIDERTVDAGRLGRWHVEVSDDGVNWTQVGVEVTDPADTQVRFDDVSARYARIVVDELRITQVIQDGVTYDPSNAPIINEVEIYLDEVDPTRFTVTFVDYDGTTQLKVERVVSGADAVAPVDPSRVGYTFDGWDKSFANVTGDLTVTARYKLVTYPLSLLLNGGVSTSPVLIPYTVESESFTLTSPTRDGYTFVGWTGMGLTEPTMIVTVAKGSVGARTYVAQWAALVEFVDFDGTVLKSESVLVGGSASAPVGLSRVGYEFTGWDTVFSNVQAALTVRAVYEVVPYGVTYVLDGGGVASANPVSYTVESESFTLVNPTRSGYTFVGWTGTGLAEPTMTVTVVKGSVGERAYVAQWTVVDKSVLTAGVSDAGEASVGVVESVDGSDVDPAGLWVTAAVQDALDAALTAAEVVLADESATQAQVDAAVAALADAVAVYEAAVKAGLRPVPVDKSVLESGMVAAGEASVGVVESVDGSDVDPTGSWVTAAVQDALDAALAAAEVVLADKSATQAEVDAAVEALADAVTVYEAAVKPGVKTVPVDKSALTAGISDAGEAVVGVVESVDGLDVDPTGSWVTAAVQDALDAALAAAEVVLADKSATQAEVDAAVEALADAVTVYESAVKAGLKTVPVDKSVLTAGISDAGEASVGV